MSATDSWLTALEARVDAGTPFTVDDARAVAAHPSLPAVGRLGERLRKALRGDTVTFGFNVPQTGALR